MGQVGAYIVGQFNSCKGKDYHHKGTRREGTFSDAAFSGLGHFLLSWPDSSEHARGYCQVGRWGRVGSFFFFYRFNGGSQQI